MNRKTLVLPAVVGLLAPVLAACGGSDSGSGDGDAIAVGTTDGFNVSKEITAPFDPAYAYDVGAWNIMRQTSQTLMVLPRGDGEPVPEAAQQCGFTDTGNERYACTLRDGLKFANGDPVTAEDVKYSIERVRKINADTEVASILSTVDTSRRRATARSSSTSTPPTPPSRSSCPHRSPASSTRTTTRRTSCVTASS